MAYNEDSSASGHDEPWIQWFCGLKGHEMFCEVERSYIEDGFNLYGLRACVSNFSDCLDLILDRIGPDDSDDSHLTQSACTLYGLIHARFIITAHGLDSMYNKYAAKEFGTCPLAQCNGQPVLPAGLRDDIGADSVKTFCPKCQCIYHPPPIRTRSTHHSSSNNSGSGSVDGAAFGTTFPHLFLMTFNNLVPDGLTPDLAYIPRVFGFRVHQSARQRNVCGGPGSIAFYSTPLVGGGKRGNGIAEAASNSIPTGGASVNGVDPTKHTTEANADYSTNVNTASLAQEQNNDDDKTSAIRTAAATQSDANSKQRKIKTSSSGTLTKVSKKIGNSSEIKRKGGGDSKIPRDIGEDSGSASKRKSKVIALVKTNNGDEESSSLKKRQKRQNI